MILPNWLNFDEAEYQNAPKIIYGSDIDYARKQDCACICTNGRTNIL